MFSSTELRWIFLRLKQNMRARLSASHSTARKFVEAKRLKCRLTSELSQGKQYVQRIPVQIPEDAALGQLLVFVGDGGALQEGSPAKSFVPRDLGQLVRAINTR